MTPTEFSKRMEIITRQSNRDRVIKDGIALVQEALGACAHLYLGGIEELSDRLRELDERQNGIGGTSD